MPEQTTARDLWHLVTFGAALTHGDIDECKQRLHDFVIDSLGDHRTGPVWWSWWPARQGLQVLDEKGWTRNDRGLRSYLRRTPGSWLVMASAASDYDPDGEAPDA